MLENDKEIHLELDEVATRPEVSARETNEVISTPLPAPPLPSKLCDVRPSRIAKLESLPDPEPLVTEKEGSFIIYDTEAKARERAKILKCSLLGSGIGAVMYAIVTLISFGGGVRLGILGLGFFSAFGARLGVDKPKTNEIQWIAAISALFGTFLGKFVLAVFVVLIVGKPPKDLHTDLPRAPSTVQRQTSSNDLLHDDQMIQALSALSKVEKKVPTVNPRANSDAGDLLGVYIPWERVCVLGIFRSLVGPWDILVLVASMFLAAMLAKPQH